MTWEGQMRIALMVGLTVVAALGSATAPAADTQTRSGERLSSAPVFRGCPSYTDPTRPDGYHVTLEFRVRENG